MHTHVYTRASTHKCNVRLGGKRGRKKSEKERGTFDIGRRMVRLERGESSRRKSKRHERGIREIDEKARR